VGPLQLSFAQITQTCSYATAYTGNSLYAYHSFLKAPWVWRL